MSEDLFELLQDQRISQPILLDIPWAARRSSDLHWIMRDCDQTRSGRYRSALLSSAPPGGVGALHAVDFDQVRKRKEVEDMLRNALHEEATVQFLLKNLYWVSDDRLAWRFDLDTLSRSIDSVGDAMPNDRVIETLTLFVRASGPVISQRAMKWRSADISPRRAWSPFQPPVIGSMPRIPKAFWKPCSPF